MKRTLIVAAALTALSGGAYAADLYSGGLKDGPIAAPAPSWTGAIVGVGLTGAFVNHNAALTANDLTAVDLNGLSGIGAGADFLAGFRYQFPNSRLVFGIEAEYAITDSPVTLSIPVAPIEYQNAAITLDGKWSIVGTAGVLVNPWTLAYVGGGYGQSFYSTSGLIKVVGDKTIDGGVFKAGLEAKLPFIADGAFIRGEYEFFLANTATLWSDTYGDTAIAVKDTANINSAKLVIGYQFGLAPGALK